MMYKIIILFFIFNVSLLGNSLNSYHLKYERDNLVITFNLEENARGEKAYYLINPYRIILNLKNTSVLPEVKKLNVLNDGFIKNIKVVEYKKNNITNTRLIVSLTKSTNYKVNKVKNKLELSIENQMIANKLRTYAIKYKKDSFDIKLDFSKKVKNERLYYLINPFRIIINLENTVLSENIIKNNSIDNKMIKKVKTIEYKKNGINNTKLIISLKESTSYKVYKNNNKLVLNIESRYGVNTKESFEKSSNKLVTNKRVRYIKKQETVFFNISSKIKIPSDFRDGIEEALTIKGKTLIEESAQREALKQQTEQQKNDCYDDKCIVNVGQMMAAENIILLNVEKKNDSLYKFKISLINVETGGKFRTITLYYKDKLDSYENLNNFAKKLVYKVYPL